MAFGWLMVATLAFLPADSATSRVQGIEMMEEVMKVIRNGKYGAPVYVGLWRDDAAPGCANTGLTHQVLMSGRGDLMGMCSGPHYGTIPGWYHALFQPECLTPA